MMAKEGTARPMFTSHTASTPPRLRWPNQMAGGNASAEATRTEKPASRRWSHTRMAIPRWPQ